MHRRHTWILRRMTKPSKLGGAPVRTQPHIEETTSYFSKCFLLSGTNDMPFPSPLSFSLQEHQIQKPMVQPTKNPCFGFFIACHSIWMLICFKWGLSLLLMQLGREKSIHGNKSWVRGHDYKMLCVLACKRRRVLSKLLPFKRNPKMTAYCVVSWQLHPQDSRDFPY